MISGLMDFDSFCMNESNTHAESQDVRGIVNLAMGDRFGRLFFVPDFETFERPGEPKQTAWLVGTEDGRSFMLNFADNKLYSVDIWPSGEDSAERTVYAGGESMSDVLSAVARFGSANESSEEVLLYIDSPDEDEYAEESKPTVKSEPATKSEEPKPTVKSEPVRTKKLKSSEPKEKTEFDGLAAQVPVVPSVAKNPGTQDARLKTEYEFQDPDTIFNDLRTYTRMVIDGTQPAMLVTGSPGVGKSFIITDELKKSGMKRDVDFYHVKGKSTAAGMYQTLYEQNGKLIVFDDMDSIFDDPNAINILKGALDSDEVREIAWIANRPLKTASGEDVPARFDFTGRVIFISNLAQKNVDPAIKSRSFVVEVALSPEDMVKYIEGLFDEVMPYDRVSTKRYALDAIKKAASENPDVQINMRTFVKAVKIVKSVKDRTVADRMIRQQCSYR